MKTTTDFTDLTDYLPQITQITQKVAIIRDFTDSMRFHNRGVSRCNPLKICENRINDAQPKSV